MNTRRIQTKIWRDDWFVELSQTGKLVFLYLFTNEFIGLTGMYELSDRQICFDCGITSGKLAEVKEELHKKVRFHNGYVYVVNAEKHDPIKGESNPLHKTRDRELESIPDATYKHLTRTIEAPSRDPQGGIDAPLGREGKGKGKEGVVKGKPSPNDLTEQIIETIATDYNLPVPFVASKADDLRNWCAAKGKSYKDYPAALRNWVKKDAERLVQAQKMPSKSFDATTALKGEGYALIQ